MSSPVLHLFRHRPYAMQSIASVVLVTFTWLLMYPTILAAQAGPGRQTTPAPATPPAEAVLADMLTALEEHLSRFQPQRASAVEAWTAHDALVPLQQRLQAVDQQLRQSFEQTAQHLAAQPLPPEFLQRHQAMVATYEAEVATLQRYLDALVAAPDAHARNAVALQAQQHLKATQTRRPHRRVDPHTLPFRVPDEKVRPPKETTQEFESALTPLPAKRAAAEVLPGLLTAAATLPATPTPDDLAPTEDV